VPMAFGDHKLQISVNEGEIGGSPFKVSVQAAPVHPPSCTATGEGLEHGTVGESASFTLETHTWFGAAVDLSAALSELRLALQAPTGALSDTPLSVRRVGTGVYDVSYRPVQVGECLLSIQISGQHVASSPYTVRVGHGCAWAVHCRASGDGLSKAVERHQAQFVVETFDQGERSAAALRSAPCAYAQARAHALAHHACAGGSSLCSPALTHTQRHTRTCARTRAQGRARTHSCTSARALTHTRARARGRLEPDCCRRRRGLCRAPQASARYSARQKPEARRQRGRRERDGRDSHR
jgi:hypothetical protein